MKFKENTSEKSEELKVEVEVKQENEPEELNDKPKLNERDTILESLVGILKIRMTVINNSAREIESVLKEIESLLNERDC